MKQTTAKSMTTAEFQVGEQVTFNPYGKPWQCTVTGIETHPRTGRVMYALKGEAITQTSGLSIEQSAWFEEYPVLLKVSGREAELLQREGLDIPIAEFNDGRFNEPEARIRKIANSIDAPLKDYVLGALEEAKGNLRDAKTLFEKAGKMGLSGATERAGKLQSNVLLAFGASKGAINTMLVCPAKDVATAVEHAKKANLSLVGGYPNIDGEPDFESNNIYSPLADRYGLARFITDIDEGVLFYEPSPKRTASLSIG